MMIGLTDNVADTNMSRPAPGLRQLAGAAA
jgi:hypothetical protein